MPADEIEYPEEIKESVDLLDVAVDSIVKALIPSGYELNEVEQEFLHTRAEYEMANLMIRMITVHLPELANVIIRSRTGEGETDAGRSNGT